MGATTKTKQAATKGRATKSRPRSKEGAAIPDFSFKVPVDPEWAAQLRKKSEWFHLDTRAKKMAYIKRLCQKIVEGFEPEKIILFGSRAYGKPRADSDIDLLVVMPYEGSHSAQAIRILTFLDVLVSLDLLVRTPEEIQQRLEMGDQFMKEIITRGKVMYEANHARVDRES
jgi:predicted nucleotidyltransferase